jgi:hypothetical protein
MIKPQIAFLPTFATICRPPRADPGMGTLCFTLPPNEASGRALATSFRRGASAERPARNARFQTLKFTSHV